MAAPVSYQLLIDVPVPLTLRIGRLGCVELPEGQYLYTGSARRAIGARIARHLRTDKPRHWHIDWLTTAPGVTVREHRRSTRPECDLNQSTPGTALIPGFGASDCRRRCGSHLKRVPVRD